MILPEALFRRWPIKCLKDCNQAPTIRGGPCSKNGSRNTWMPICPTLGEKVRPPKRYIRAVCSCGLIFKNIKDWAATKIIDFYLFTYLKKSLFHCAQCEGPGCCDKSGIIEYWFYSYGKRHRQCKNQ